VKRFCSGNHLRGAGGVVGVVPDSYDDFEIAMEQFPVLVAGGGARIGLFCSGAKAAEEAVGAGHGYGRHSREEDDGGILFVDGFCGFVNGADGERDGIEPGEGEDLSEHGGNERVGAIADGDDNDGAVAVVRGRGTK